MVLDRETGRTSCTMFEELDDLLPRDCLLVANNSMVMPARIMGTKPSGGRLECLLLTPLPLIEPEKMNGGSFRAEVECVLRSSKPLRPGQEADLGQGLSLSLIERNEFGRCRARLHWTGDLACVLEKVGTIPLPPYIQRSPEALDAARYQTVYAQAEKMGSAAAPTAGLHFTEKLRRRILEGGRQWAEVTLYVGYGTFSPVRTRDIRDHAMHSEHVDIPATTATLVAEAKREGRPVVALGTTSARSLEGAYRTLGKIRPFAGETDIFIRPGYTFRVVDQMITNFHLPGSSLVIMVSALAGRKRVLEAYARAVEEEFRFFSYGDAMYIR